MSRKDFDSYLQLDPVIPIKLGGKDWQLEINNYAVKGIFQDTGHNLLSMGFQKEQMQDPKVMGSMLFWGLKTHHPDLTLDEVDKMLTFRHSPYILDKLLLCLDMYAPESDKEEIKEEIKESVEGQTKDPK